MNSQLRLLTDTCHWTVSFARDVHEIQIQHRKAMVSLHEGNLFWASGAAS